MTAVEKLSDFMPGLKAENHDMHEDANGLNGMHGNDMNDEEEEFPETEFDGRQNRSFALPASSNGKLSKNLDISSHILLNGSEDNLANMTDDMDEMDEVSDLVINESPDDTNDEIDSSMGSDFNNSHSQQMDLESTPEGADKVLTTTIHGKNKTFYHCTLCPYRHASKLEVSRHLQRHKESGPYQCSICGYSADSSIGIRTHQRVHYPEQYQNVTKKKAQSPKSDIIKSKSPVATSDDVGESPEAKKAKLDSSPSASEKPGATPRSASSTANPGKANYLNSLLAKKTAELHGGSSGSGDGPSLNMNVDFGETSSNGGSVVGDNGEERRLISEKEGNGRRYYCDRCPFTCAHSSRLKAHWAKHGADLPHKCAYCDYAAVTPHFLNSHEVLHKDGAMPIKKIIELTEKAKQPKHLRTDSNASSRAGSTPSSSVDTPLSDRKLVPVPNQKTSAGIVHLKDASGKSVFKCNQCPYSTLWRKNLHRHVARHGAGLQFACPHCSYSCKSQDWMTRHIRLHATKSPRKLPLSPASAAAGTTLVRPKKDPASVEVDDSWEYYLVPGQRFYTCSYCGGHGTGDKLRQHILYHKMDYEFRCPHCSYSNSTEKFVTLHVEKVHVPQLRNTGARFTCDACPFRCDEEIGIVNHRRTHQLDAAAAAGVGADHSHHAAAPDADDAASNDSFSSDLSKATSASQAAAAAAHHRPRAPRSTYLYRCAECPYVCRGKGCLDLHKA